MGPPEDIVGETMETCHGLRRETLRQAGDRTGLRSVGATTRYGYKGRLQISTRCGGIYSTVHVTGMPMGLQTTRPPRRSWKKPEIATDHMYLVAGFMVAEHSYDINSGTKRVWRSPSMPVKRMSLVRQAIWSALPWESIYRQTGQSFRFQSYSCNASISPILCLRYTSYES